jgi:hypothetical protein
LQSESDGAAINVKSVYLLSGKSGLEYLPKIMKEMSETEGAMMAQDQMDMHGDDNEEMNSPVNVDGSPRLMPKDLQIDFDSFLNGRPEQRSWDDQGHIW